MSQTPDVFCLWGHLALVRVRHQNGRRVTLAFQAELEHTQQPAVKLGASFLIWSLSFELNASLLPTEKSISSTNTWCLFPRLQFVTRLAECARAPKIGWGEEKEGEAKLKD
jgi:hypothetical protein